MSKKYFTIYLPVKGEIKEGDKTLIKGKDGSMGIFTRIKEDDPNGLGRITSGHLPLQLDVGSTLVQYTLPKGLKKYLLFLCSRDIQVGDRVYDIQSQLYGKITEGGNLIDTYNMLREDEMELITTLDPIKVIGEISPEATWVKEGDEFDEDWVKIERGFFGTIRILLKCPCCGGFK